MIVAFEARRLDPAADALFLDLDGTLLDIAPSPGAVRVPAHLPGVLAALGARFGGAVAVLTGRNLAVLDALLGLPALPAAGLHGLERRGPGMPSSPPPPLPPGLRARLEAFAADRPGVLVEDKGAALALHTRARPGSDAEALAFLAALPEVRAGLLRVQRGRRVAELRPPGADKGEALRGFMAAPPFAGRRPVAFGDDLTDEDAFAAAAGLGGFGVRVGHGPRATRAAASLPSPAALRALLAGLAGA